jgi:succinyl-diaminopimelate desuccinylase
MLQKVIAINSENPPGNEWALAQFIEKDMKSLKGVEVKTYTYAKKRPNVIATLKGTLPRAQAKKGAILITPHFDTVPIGEGWKQNPLGGKIVGNKLYGRGASDDKCNLASSLEIMRSLVEDGVTLKHDVIMAATADEETGSNYGIIPLCEKGVINPRLALVLDSDEHKVMVAQKGLIHGRIKIFGKRAHGAYNWLGDNAISRAARIITKLEKMKFPAYTKHPRLHGPTINIGVINGGDKCNMVCDTVEFSIDIRFLPGMKHQAILKTVKSIVSSEAKKFEIEADDIQLPYEISEKHKAVVQYLKTAKTARYKAELEGSEGATVITLFQKFKIPAFSVGSSAPGTAHTTDEYVKVNSVIKTTHLLKQYIKDFDLI